MGGGFRFASSRTRHNSVRKRPEARRRTAACRRDATARTRARGRFSGTELVAVNQSPALEARQSSAHSSMSGCLTNARVARKVQILLADHDVVRLIDVRHGPSGRRRAGFLHASSWIIAARNRAQPGRASTRMQAGCDGHDARWRLVVGCSSCALEACRPRRSVQPKTSSGRWKRRQGPRGAEPLRAVDAAAATFAGSLRRPFQALVTPQPLDALAVHVPAFPAHDPGGQLVNPSADALQRSRGAARSTTGHQKAHDLSDRMTSSKPCSSVRKARLSVVQSSNWQLSKPMTPNTF
jgi:hypothetical protein